MSASVGGTVDLESIAATLFASKVTVLGLDDGLHIKSTGESRSLKSRPTIVFPDLLVS